MCILSCREVSVDNECKRLENQKRRPVAKRIAQKTYSRRNNDHSQIVLKKNFNLRPTNP